MQITPYHAKYYAYELTKQSSSDSIQKLATTLVDAQVDLNPHQVEAALFAFQSPLSKGAILADEVGLGKTIEAGLALSQKWAERKRRILIIAPSSLRKQWNQELADKFFIPSIILDSKGFNKIKKQGNHNPFEQKDLVVICSYHFARNKQSEISWVNWDLAVIDEAHKLRNVYKTNNKIGKAIKSALKDTNKILLTATPLQNSLLELFGLVSIIDEYAFGDLKSFKQQYSYLDDAAFKHLRKRLAPICKRTLRRDVLHYINYTNRIAILKEYYPTDKEQQLYEAVSAYLQKTTLYALPPSQRKLMTLIMRKLLASSTYAISNTLQRLKEKLELTLTEAIRETVDLSGEYEAYQSTEDEWGSERIEEIRRIYTEQELTEIEDEIEELRHIHRLATNILENSKGTALLKALKVGFEKLDEQEGANRKAIIFTESRRTQDYLYQLLTDNGYAGEIVLFNGTNNSEGTKQIYRDWKQKYANTGRISGAKSADQRAALVDYFREEATIMIATEAAAEGINLQFCSLVINYDLPWNPQRIEQRIGRCHRYKQKFDVVVINFLNKRNAADKRVYELLDEKFRLFDGVFGASDEVLGSIESGVDFEKRIAEIYQTCRSEAEIQSSFDTLQKEMENSIEAHMNITKQSLLDHFDKEVHEKLRVSLEESRDYLNKYESWLWQMTRYYLRSNAKFEDENLAFELQKSPFVSEDIPLGRYKIGKYIQDAHTYRIGHPLAQEVIRACKSLPLAVRMLELDYTSTRSNIFALEDLVGQSGWMKVINFRISSFEEEDYVLLVGLTDTGKRLDTEQCQHLLSLTGKTHLCDEVQHNKLAIDQFLTDRMHELTTDNMERNAAFFDAEMDKLDNWADDLKNSLELELKNLEREIKSRKTEARKITELQAKVKEQRKIKELEKRRSELRKNLYQAQDEVDTQKEALIDRIEGRMSQHSQTEELFTVRWSLV